MTVTPKSDLFQSRTNMVSDRLFPGPEGFNISVSMSNITSAGTVPLSKNPYTAANQPQADTIEVVSDQAGDTTQTITHVGINAAGERVSEKVTLLGTSVAATTQLFTYWEYSLLSAVCAGTVSIREGSHNAEITTITAGDLCTYVSHIYAGEKNLYITKFSGKLTSLSGNVTLTLRRYPLAASSPAPTTGYFDVEVLSLFDTEGYLSESVEFPAAIFIPSGSYVAVHAAGEGGDDEDVTVTIQGYRR